MNPTILGAALVIVLPTVVSVGGGAIMTRLSGRAIVTSQLAKLPKADRTPLNSRWLGYDKPAVERHWGVLDRAALAAETRFLEIDLFFPIVYGGAFLVALLIAWASLGREFNPAWIVAVVAVTIASDWTENLTLLPQIRAFATSGAASLDAGRIGIAAAATMLKLAGVVTLMLVTAGMAIRMFWR
jgi:hypothetical protein